MSYQVIRASEIAVYVYCRRAWELHRNGHQPNNADRLVAGIDYHREHHKRVRNSKKMSKVALAILFTAICVATFWLVWSL